MPIEICIWNFSANLVHFSALCI